MRLTTFIVQMKINHCYYIAVAQTHSLATLSFSFFRKFYFDFSTDPTHFGTNLNTSIIQFYPKKKHYDSAVWMTVCLCACIWDEYGRSKRPFIWYLHSAFAWCKQPKIIHHQKCLKPLEIEFVYNLNEYLLSNITIIVHNVLEKTAQ